MSFTFVNQTSNDDGSGSTITQLDIASYSTTAGSMLVGWCKHEGASTTLSVARSDTTEPWTAATYQQHSNLDLSGQFFYLVGSGGGTQTYRLSLAAARPFVTFILFEYTFSGGTPTLDAQVTAIGNSAAPNSGNASPTGTDGVAFGGYGEYVGATASAGLINGAAADGGIYLTTPDPTTYSAAWRKTYSAGFTGAASCTAGGSAPWVCNFLSFKIAASGAVIPLMGQACL